MTQFICSAAILAVTVLYFVWKAYRQVLEQRDEVLRQRGAYLLWVAADCVDEIDPFQAEAEVDRVLDVI
jgi:membrane protein implicated in regulation of membrane protease activity